MRVTEIGGLLCHFVCLAGKEAGAARWARVFWKHAALLHPLRIPRLLLRSCHVPRGIIFRRLFNFAVNIFNFRPYTIKVRGLFASLLSQLQV